MYNKGDIVIIRELSEMEDRTKHPKFTPNMYKLCGLYAKINFVSHWIDEDQYFYSLDFPSKLGNSYSFTDYMLKPYEIQKR